VQKFSISNSSESLQAGQDQSVVLATFTNNSGGYGVNFSYNVTVYDVVGNQVDDFTGTSSVLPNNSRYLVLSNIPDNASDIGLIGIKTNNLTPMSPAQIAAYNLSVDNIVTSVSENGGYISGTIMNGTASWMNDVKLSAVIYDLSGNVVTAVGYDLGAVAASGKESFQIPLPTMDIRTANSVDKTKTEVFYEVAQN
jgi:hypothetical protein